MTLNSAASQPLSSRWQPTMSSSESHSKTARQARKIFLKDAPIQSWPWVPKVQKLFESVKPCLLNAQLSRVSSGAFAAQLEGSTVAAVGSRMQTRTAQDFPSASACCKKATIEEPRIWLLALGPTPSRHLPTFVLLTAMRDREEGGRILLTQALS